MIYKICMYTMNHYGSWGRDHGGVSVAHKIISPIQFPQMMMEQYWLADKT